MKASAKCVFLLVVCLTVMSSNVHGQTYILDVLEELPANTLVGYITDAPEFNEAIRSTNRADLRYTFFAQGNPRTANLRIDDSTGAIYTAGRIDREALCPDQPDQPHALCHIDVEVAAYSEGFFKIFRMRVIVKDINDNDPEFPEPEIHISVQESVPVNFILPISGAADKDAEGNNSVQTYDLVPERSQFRISIIKNLDGTPEIGIVVREKLDREKIPSYQMRVLAKDGGSPPRTGTVIVNVVVSDFNDHFPVFTKSLYNVTIRENLPVNTPIVQVIASDEDTGVNGEVKYRFTSATMSKIQNVFSMNDTTGEILVKGTVNYEDVKLYRLVVEAFDQGSQPQSSQALVVVNLLDVNDNSPEMNFNFLSGLDHAEISENANPNDFVARISVIDKDSGHNAAVECLITENYFKLEHLYENEFQVLLNTKLDREAKSDFNVTVICEDKGTSRRSGNGSFIVNVKDENDNSPTFAVSPYVVSVRENATLGQDIFQVSATDADVGVNGKISYELYGVDSAHFRVDRNSGMLSVKTKLDYETKHEMSFYIIARDGGALPLSNNVTVVVRVLDVNDEVPEFNQTSYKFSVLEEGPIDVVVGKVYANDLDLGIGGQVTYSLRESAKTRAMFVISSTNGEIRTVQSIDREKHPSIILTVVATDKGKRSLSSSVSVHVKVLDINDNSPNISFPNSSARSVTVFTNRTKQTSFLTVLAQDPDDGENQTLSYSVVSGDPKKLFNLNSENGEMFLSKDINDEVSSREKFILLISVMDGGTPQMVTLTRLNVTVVHVNESAVYLPRDDGIPSNFAIVIAVICATTFVSVIIIVIIFIIRRKNMREESDSSTDSKNKLSHQKELQPSSIPDSNNSDNSGSINKSDKKGVNFVFENEHSLLGGESSTDPPLIDTPIKQQYDTVRPQHDVIRQPQSLGSPNSINFIWMDPQKDKGRQLSNGVTSPSPRTVSDGKMWLHDPRGNSVFDVTKRPDDATSDMSGETVTSDSGRGGSEDDVHSGRHCPMDEQESFTHAVIERGLEGEYVDMQRSPLSYMAALKSDERLSNNLPDHYYKILQKHPRSSASSDSGVISYPINGQVRDHPDYIGPKGDHPAYTKMCPINMAAHLAQKLPPPIPPRFKGLNGDSEEQNCRSLGTRQTLSHATKTTDVSKMCNAAKNRGEITFVSKRRESVVSDLTLDTVDGDDSATTTSGSYTIDDLSDCEGHEFDSVNV